MASSLAIHGLLLAWILHSPAPQIITASSVMAGDHGTSMTLLYWPGGPVGKEDEQNIHPRKHSPGLHPSVSKQALAYAREQARKPDPQVDAPLSQIGKDDQTDASQQSDEAAAARAGSPYGSLSSGLFSGDEIRPALPIRPFDPVIGRTEVASVHEGDVVIEITIDEKGNVVRTIVLESLSPDIDAKVVAALENWHFYPATRDGVAIASKQDVHYHFRDR